MIVFLVDSQYVVHVTGVATINCGIYSIPYTHKSLYISAVIAGFRLETSYIRVSISDAGIR